MWGGCHSGLKTNFKLYICIPYANHIIQNKHEFGPAETTLKLLKQCNKGSYMNCWEQKYIQEYHRSGKLITEQQTYEYNPSLQ